MILKDAVLNRWLSFTHPVSVIQVNQTEDVLPALVEVEQNVQKRNLFAAGFVSYEAAPGLNPALKVRFMEGFPLLWFGLYNSPKDFELSPPEKVYNLDWAPNIQQDEYEDAILSIKEWIARGWTYQVNYTLRLKTGFQEGGLTPQDGILAGDPLSAWKLFLQLAHAQQANYSAYVDTGNFVICSASPELFISRQGNELVSQPMKGTAPRGRSLDEDLLQADWLRTSEKNRAENVMIVDMIRNDMGRIADKSSVSVSQLFQVIRFPTVWQMISTVSSRSGAPFSEIMKAMFPCASITGAPKVSTMRIIADLEPQPRRIYTGSIGFLAPDKRLQFNVAIRTVLVDRQKGQAEYGVGGGIVWDSDPQEEYQECKIKARVLNTSPLKFSLLETCLWTPQGEIFLRDYHLKRLCDSAEYFAYPLNLVELYEQLDRVTGSLPPMDHRIRILVARNGAIKIEVSLFNQTDAAQPVTLTIAKSPVDSANPFLYHKTTNRRIYDEAVANPGKTDLRSTASFDDRILWNEKYEVTETTIANLVYRLGDEIYTPPVGCGLLPGVFRAYLLDQGKIKERALLLKGIPECDEFWTINSLRLWRKAIVVA